MSNESFDDRSGGSDRLVQENEALRRDFEQLRMVVGQLAQANALEHVVSHGFNELTTLLRPLADLRPVRQELPREVRENLERQLRAIRHPRWVGTEFNVVDDNNRRGGAA
jgi:hypothetical protein